AVAVVEQRTNAERVALLGAARLAAGRFTRHFLFHRAADHAGAGHRLGVRHTDADRPGGLIGHLAADVDRVRFRPALGDAPGDGAWIRLGPGLRPVSGHVADDRPLLAHALASGHRNLLADFARHPDLDSLGAHAGR